MRIRELVENIDVDIHFNNKNNEDLGFDISDDLLFYMKNNDDVYRRHVYPQLVKHKHSLQHGKADRMLFGSAVHEAYKSYTKEFPIRKLPETLPNDVHEKVCLELFKQCTEEYRSNKK